MHTLLGFMGGGKKKKPRPAEPENTYFTPAPRDDGWSKRPLFDLNKYYKEKEQRRQAVKDAHSILPAHDYETENRNRPRVVYAARPYSWNPNGGGGPEYYRRIT